MGNLRGIGKLCNFEDDLEELRKARKIWKISKRSRFRRRKWIAQLPKEKGKVKNFRGGITKLKKSI